MNISNNSISDSFDDERFFHRLHIIQGSIYIPIFCAGILNNLLTILIILLNRDMHTVTNCYLLNLAISDSLPLIVSLPFEIAFLPIKLPWEELGCKLRSLLAETSTNASILTISAFTIERYIAVCRPLHTSILTTTRRAIKIQILIWFIAILSSTPYFYITTKSDSGCDFDQDYELFSKICFYVSATIFFVLPAFILCILYALMARRLYSVGLLDDVRWSKSSGTDSCSSPTAVQAIQRESSGLEELNKQRRHSSVPSIPARYASIPRSTKTSASLSVNIQAMKKSAFKMLFAVVIAFIICYAPFHVQRLITSSSNVRHLSLIQRRAVTIFYFISGILYYLGSTINPIFYHLFSRKYREAFIRTMKCRRYEYEHYHPKNYYIRKTAKSPPVTPLILYPNLPRGPLNITPNRQRRSKPMEAMYRSPIKYKTSLDMIYNKQRALKSSFPAFNIERMR